MDTRTLKVVIVGNGSSAEKALGSLGVKSEEAGGKLAKIGEIGAKLGVGLGLALGVAAVESVRLASGFQSAMELIRTQAGQSQTEVDKMSKAVLGLAGQTATAPDELAKGLYHLESSGLHGARALQALKIAAEGAKVGQANLEDVTNALNAAIASNIPGVQNMSQAMGALNSIVGAGDMRMQDLSEALGTGVLATVKGFGLSLNDVGAALATFGDNNIRGADAATQLRMAVTFMAKPAATADKALKSIGFTTKTLANDMAKGGLTLALTHLHHAMQKAGYTGAKAGELLLDAFGHKAGTGLSVLIGQFDRYQSKVEEVKKGASGFGDAWKATTETFKFHVDQLKASAEALGITVGNVLIPPLTTVAKVLSGALTTAINAVEPAFARLKEMFKGGGSSGMTSQLEKTFAVIRKFGTELEPIVVKFAETLKNTLGRGIREISDAFQKDLLPGIQKILPVLEPVVAFILKMFGSAIIGVLNGAINVIKGAFEVIGGLFSFIADLVTGKWGKLWGDVKEIAEGVWNLIKGALEIWWNMGILHVFEHGFTSLLDMVTGGWKGLGKLFEGGVKALDDLLMKVIDILTKPFRDGFKAVEEYVTTGWNYIKGQFTGGVGGVKGIIGRIIEVVTYPYRQAFAIAKDLITGHWSQAISAFETGVKTVGSVIGRVPGIIANVFKDAGSWLVDAGKQVVNGLINGIQSMAADVAKTVSNIASSIGSSVKGALGIKSPSRVMHQLGIYTAQGLVTGMNAGSADVASAAQGLANAVTGGYGVQAANVALRGSQAPSGGHAPKVDVHLEVNVAGTLDQRALPGLQAAVRAELAEVVREIRSGSR